MSKTDPATISMYTAAGPEATTLMERNALITVPKSPAGVVDIESHANKTFIEREVAIKAIDISAAPDGRWVEEALYGGSPAAKKAALWAIFAYDLEIARQLAKVSAYCADLTAEEVTLLERPVTQKMEHFDRRQLVNVIFKIGGLQRTELAERWRIRKEAAKTHTASIASVPPKSTKDSARHRAARALRTDGGIGRKTKAAEVKKISKRK